MLQRCIHVVSLSCYSFWLIAMDPEVRWCLQRYVMRGLAAVFCVYQIRILHRRSFDLLVQQTLLIISPTLCCLSSIISKIEEIMLCVEWKEWSSVDIFSYARIVIFCPPKAFYGFELDVLIIMPFDSYMFVYTHEGDVIQSHINKLYIDAQATTIYKKAQYFWESSDVHWDSVFHQLSLDRSQKPTSLCILIDCSEQRCIWEGELWYSLFLAISTAFIFRSFF
jgi:hypothetical protein